jgi:hypothetical protein
MRVLIAYAVASTVAVVVLATSLHTANNHIAALERARPATRPAVAVTQPAAGTRTFRAKNGVVLGAGELARLDEEDRQIERKVAELEYFWSKQPSARARATAVNPR